MKEVTYQIIHERLDGLERRTTTVENSQVHLTSVLEALILRISLLTGVLKVLLPTTGLDIDLDEALELLKQRASQEGLIE